MVKRDLEQYLRMQRAIARYMDELKTGDFTTLESVIGSDVEHPYTEHPIPVHGYDTKRVASLGTRITALEAKCKRIEVFISSVQDEELQAILRYRYLHGCSWPRVMRKLHCRLSPDAARKRVERFFEKNI